jgi:hypothetical protein
MDKLIKEQNSYVIRGMFKGEEQELFRCPAGDDSMLSHYINEHRAFVGFEDDDTEDVRKVPGKEMVSYYRLYWRDGWYGRWLDESNDYKPDIVDCAGIDRIVSWISENFPKGCTFAMSRYFSDNFKGYCENKRFLIRPIMSEYYKVLIDTTYGNGDYPVRIYLYRDIEE